MPARSPALPVVSTVTGLISLTLPTSSWLRFEPPARLRRSEIAPLSGTGCAAGANFTGDHSEENLNKVTYYTPRFAGFQVGVSYLPDQSNRGQGSGFNLGVVPNPAGPDRTDYNAGLSKNIFTGGINYDNKFGDVSVTAAATGEYGKAEVSTFEDLKAWNAGAKASYMGFSLAGSYGSWGSSNQLKSDHANDTYYWTAGSAYEYGPFGVSVTYLNSQFDCGLTNAEGYCAGWLLRWWRTAATGMTSSPTLSIGADYKLAPGLTPYAEVSFYDENAAGANTATQHWDNKGTVGIVGTQLNF